MKYITGSKTRGLSPLPVLHRSEKSYNQVIGFLDDRQLLRHGDNSKFDNYPIYTVFARLLPLLLLKKIDRLAALARKGKEGKREKRYLESSGLAQHSETDSAVAVAGVEVAATRGTAMPWIVVPRTAA